MPTNPNDAVAARAKAYRDMLRAIPGLDGMYRLAAALVADPAPPTRRLLIVGAGGGREIEALGAHATVLDITALDPSTDNLRGAEQVAREIGVNDRIRFVTGTLDALPPGPAFDAATSLLVMQHLADDGAKLAYLQALRDRLRPGATLIHADVSVDGPKEFARLVPAYLAHARRAAIPDDVARIDLNKIPDMPVISPQRTSALFVEAGLAPPREVFRSLWYRCWVSTRPDA
ncbi:MAG: class I SAM-dependent methyltransferase [Maritimibacter sp.]|nr:class I SAM-dependent methyltransferase [Maritimibacter sp.]